MRREIRFGGYGGQGIALMGLLLGKAAAVYDKKNAVFTQSYGPESRGGASSADVVVDESAVDFPLVTQPDFLVVMFQEAYQKFHPKLGKNGLLFLDQDLVTPQTKSAHSFAIPATKIAESLGNKMAANVVMLGFFGALSGVVRREALGESLKATLKPKYLKLNLDAFSEGWNFAKDHVLVRK